MKSVIIVLLVTVLVGLSLADNLDRFCANIPDARFTASPRSCQHWIFCQNNSAVGEGVCERFFYFDEFMQMCRYPEFVTCNIANVNVTCPETDFELQPHPEACDQFIVCDSGFARVRDCAPGLWFNEEINGCDLPENTVCPMEQPELNYVCDENLTYVTYHPNNCQDFILCVRGRKTVQSCAGSLVFDPVKLRCDFPKNVECELPEANVDHVCDPKVLFYDVPHPTNCEYFIRCINGNRQVERCAQGLIFDMVNAQCNIPMNSTCGSTQPTSTTASTTTTTQSTTTASSTTTQSTTTASSTTSTTLPPVPSCPACPV